VEAEWRRGRKRKDGGKFGIIYGMRRQTSRGTTWRGRIRPRRAVLSARARASLRRDALGRVVEREESVLAGDTVTSRYEYDVRGRLVTVTTNGVVSELLYTGKGSFNTEAQRGLMSMEQKNKCDGLVVRAYMVYWLAFGFVSGSLMSGSSSNALAALFSLYASSAFLFAYFCKERIKIAPWRCFPLFALLIAFMIVPYKLPLGDYFPYFSMVSIAYIGVAFIYTYILKAQILKGPWRYLFPFFFLFLTMHVSAWGLLGEHLW